MINLVNTSFFPFQGRPALWGWLFYFCLGFWKALRRLFCVLLVVPDFFFWCFMVFLISSVLLGLTPLVLRTSGDLLSLGPYWRTFWWLFFVFFWGGLLKQIQVFVCTESTSIHQERPHTHWTVVSVNKAGLRNLENLNQSICLNMLNSNYRNSSWVGQVKWL